MTDFHPFARVWRNAEDYFDDRFREGEVAFKPLLPEDERTGLVKVLTRSWTVGDILTAVGGSGLYLRAFEELKNVSEPRYPEFYTLVADKVELPSLPLYP